MGRPLKYRPEIGARYGSRVIVRELEERSAVGKHLMVEVLCDCGQQEVTHFYSLRQGKASQCHHCMTGYHKAIPGTRYGTRILVREVGKRHHNRRVATICDCGARAEITFAALRAGNTCLKCNKRLFRVPVVPGERFGCLTVLRELTRDERKLTNSGSTCVMVVCDCGEASGRRLLDVRRNPPKRCSKCGVGRPVKLRF